MVNIINRLIFRLRLSSTVRGNIDVMPGLRILEDLYFELKDKEFDR